MATIYRRHKTWWIKYYKDREPFRRSLRTTNKKVALTEKARIEYELLTGNHNESQEQLHELSEIVEAYCAHLKANVRETTYGRRLSYLRQLFGEIGPSLKKRGTERTYIRRKGEAVKPFKVQYLEDITPGIIQAFIDARRARDGIVEKTANEIRATLHTFFNYAIRYHNFFSKDRRFPNPAAAVKLLTVPRKPIAHLKSTEEIDEQLRAVEHDPALHAAVAIAIYAGLRRSALVWLTKEDVDLEKRKIFVRQKTVDGATWKPKTVESDRAVPISRALIRILRKYKSPNGTPWFLPSPRGFRWDPDRFYQALKRANRKAGLNNNWLTFRHTFGSMLAQENVSLYKIAKLMGNSPEIARRHYAALLPSELTEEVEFDRRPQVPEELFFIDASGKRTPVEHPKRDSVS